MKLLVDMNLSPEWCPALAREGWETVHWSTLGDPRATDRTIMEWARVHGYVVFTHDLDFGAILAATGAAGPSVFQIRTQDVAPEHLIGLVAQALRQLQATLQAGAIVSVDEARARARILPLEP